MKKFWAGIWPFAFLAVLSCGGSVGAQIPEQPKGNYWIKAIGGTGKDYAPSFIEDADGYTLVGYSESFGAGRMDFLIVHIDKDGNLLWSKSIGGNNEDKAYVVRKTSDGGYLLIGNTLSFGSGKEDVLLVKLNSNKELEWARAIGETDTDLGQGLLESKDGNYVVCGTTRFPNQKVAAFLAKIDKNGNRIFSKTITSQDSDTSCSGLEETADSGYVMIGHITGGVLVIKLNKDFVIEWAESVGTGIGEGMLYANWDGIRQTSDGGYIFAGKTSQDGDADYFAIKIKADGSLEWSDFLGAKGYDAGWTINEVDDGYIGGGTIGRVARTGSLEGDPGDVLFVKADKDGNVNWASAFAGPGVELDEIEEIKQTKERDGYVFSGVVASVEGKGSDFLVGKIDKDGLVKNCNNIKSLRIVNTKPSVSPSSMPDSIAEISYTVDRKPLLLGIKDVMLTFSPVSPEITDAQPDVETICKYP